MFVFCRLFIELTCHMTENLFVLWYLIEEVPIVEITTQVKMNVMDFSSQSVFQSSFKGTHFHVATLGWLSELGKSSRGFSCLGGYSVTRGKTLGERVSCDIAFKAKEVLKERRKTNMTIAHKTAVFRHLVYLNWTNVGCHEATNSTIANDNKMETMSEWSGFPSKMGM